MISAGATVDRRRQIFTGAIQAMAAALGRNGRPVLYGANGKPLAPVGLEAYTFRKTAARRSGSLKNWIPKRLVSDIEAATERELIVSRSMDLAGSDAHAAGILETFAVTIVGGGLAPHPLPAAGPGDLSADDLKTLRTAEKSIYRAWSPTADAGNRMTFAALQNLAQRMLLLYGEFLFLLPMLADDPLRPYSLALQSICPLRLKTPLDLSTDPNIRDGVEVGPYGEPVAYWIKKASPTGWPTLDTSANFMRIPARVGRRLNVLHGFIVSDAEQVRGLPFFAPAIKLFRDLSDYLDAELVSNIVTAAFSLFIETAAADPSFPAAGLATFSGAEAKDDGTTFERRYQELVPGQIMFGDAGQQPHTISANRPGTTFEPFIKVIEHSIAMSLGVPYPVLFKNFSGMNYASYRSAMLEAWRLFKTRRTWLAQSFCTPVWRMLMEEAWLRGDLPVDDYYGREAALTAAEWIGPPKGQIEPVKEVQADILAVQHNLKSREEVMLEQGRDLTATFERLSAEEQLMAQLGLDETQLENPPQEKSSDATD